MNNIAPNIAKIMLFSVSSILVVSKHKEH